MWRSRPKAFVWSFTPIPRDSSADSWGWTSGRKTRELSHKPLRSSESDGGCRSASGSAPSPTQLTITPGDQSRNVGGAVNTPAGPDCKFYGGDQISDVIKGASFGGVDACPISIGQSIQTQTGVSTGNITRKGLDVRIGSNGDSFGDGFGQDPQGHYFVKKADSPRLGIIPVAQDMTGNWPLTGNATMLMQGYVLVYSGDTSKPPDYPAYSGGGSRLTIVKIVFEYESITTRKT